MSPLLIDSCITGELTERQQCYFSDNCPSVMQNHVCYKMVISLVIDGVVMRFQDEDRSFQHEYTG